MRGFLQTALLVAAAGAVAKRGFVATGCSGDCSDPQLLSSAGWYYGYNVGDPYTPAEPSRFTPMHWCLSALNASVPAGTNETFMMGFNEPNLSSQCNMSAQSVAQAWGTVMARWPSSLLVSPATAGNGSQWFDEFFAACKDLYGPTGCRIAHVAVHDYSCEAPSTMGYLQYIHDRYGLPVWLTEFSCEDAAGKRPMADQLTYMKAIIPQLDAAPFVYRYAWMSARDPAGLRGLVAVGGDGKPALTQLGELYNSL